MLKRLLRATFVALLFPFFLQASFILKNSNLKPEAVSLIEKMGTELTQKTNISVYLLDTNESFPIGFNFVEYTKKYSKEMNQPSILFIFAPQAKITAITEITGRVALVPSEDTLRKLYDNSPVQNAVLDVITVLDKNSISDKYNIGMVQGYSELCDQIADAKDVELMSTIPNDTHYVILGFRVILLIGLILVAWIYFFEPILLRFKK